LLHTEGTFTPVLKGKKLLKTPLTKLNNQGFLIFLLVDGRIWIGMCSWIQIIIIPDPDLGGTKTQNSVLQELNAQLHIQGLPIHIHFNPN
jgi:hypothetical protein